MENQELFHLENAKAVRMFRMRECLNKKYSQFKVWINGRSDFFSRLSEFSITRKKVIQIHLVLFCLMLGAFLAEEHLILAILMTGIAMVLIFKFKNSKKGGCK